MKSRIEIYCKELRLGNRIAECYGDIIADSHEEFLLNLLKHEVENRAVARKNRYIKQANFDVHKTMEGYEFRDIEFPTHLPREKVTSLEFLIKKENLILYGNVGTGKTHLATALGIHACEQGKTVKFYQTARLVNELIEANNTGRLQKLLRSLEKCDLIICDEWGYVPLSADGAQLLFQVISSCYEKRSLILTTNLEFSKWNNIFHDERMTTALIDRLIHHSHLITFSGTSFRLRNSTMNI